MGQRFRVNKQDVENGARIEGDRHPWMSMRTRRRIARENLSSHPKFYIIEGQAEYLRTNAERGLKPVKRRRRPPRQDPFAALPPGFHDTPFTG